MLATATNAQWPQLLMHLEVAGHVLRFAENGPLTIAVNGVDHMYSGGIEISPITWAISTFGVSAEPRTVQVAVYLPHWVPIERMDSLLSASLATVYIWIGGDFNTALKVITARPRDPIYLDPTEPYKLTFSLERDLLDSASWPSSYSKVKPDSWASLGIGDIAESAIGAYRPDVFGQPGIGSYGPSYSTTSRTYDAITENDGGTVLFDSYYRLVVAGHHVPESTLSSGIKIWGSTGAGGALADLINGLDDRNKAVCYVDLTTYAGTLSHITSNLPASVAWVKEGKSGLLGDVIDYVLGKSSLAQEEYGIDWIRFRAAKARLNQLGRLDFAQSDPVTPIDWIRDTLGALFPIYVADEGEGIYIDVWRYQARQDEAVIEIDTSKPGIRCIAPISISGDIVNDVTVEGAYSSTLGRYLTSVRWSGSQAVITSEENVRTSPVLRRSDIIHRNRSISVQTNLVWDSATLDTIGHWLSHKGALQQKEVGYAIPWKDYNLHCGDIVRINDTARGFADTLAIISGAQYTKGELQIRLSVLPR